MGKIDLTVAERLLALATNHAASDAEKRTAALLVCNWLQHEGVLAEYRKLRKVDIGPLSSWEEEQAEWWAVARELVLLHRVAAAPEYLRPRWKDVQETLRRRLYARGYRPRTEEEIGEVLGKPRELRPDEVVVLR